MANTSKVLFKHTFNLKELETKFPPKFLNTNKKYIFSQLPEQKGDYAEQQIRVSKWPILEFPSHFPYPFLTKQSMFQDVFPYDPSPPHTTSWYLNFADTRLFGFYHGPLFAQDEMQVMEHPCLASLKEALRDLANKKPGASPYTRSNGYSTPILIRGARRRLEVATDPNPAAGRPNGLYGNVFETATPEVLDNAVHVIDPPTISNIIAMEAPKGGEGPYSRTEIADIFGTTFSGFQAARLESVEDAPNTRVVVHTGNWGTGAFGGNKTLMALLQMLAAQAAQIHELVYHTVDAPSTAEYKMGKSYYDHYLFRNDVSVEDTLEKIYKRKFVWRTPDGN